MIPQMSLYFMCKENSLNRCTMTCFSLALFFILLVFSFMFLARFFVFACLGCPHHRRPSISFRCWFYCCSWRCNLLVIAISYPSPENPLIWVLFMHMVSHYLCMEKNHLFNIQKSIPSQIDHVDMIAIIALVIEKKNQFNKTSQHRKNKKKKSWFINSIISHRICHSLCNDVRLQYMFVCLIFCFG